MLPILDARAAGRRPTVTSLGAMTMGLGLLALVAPFRVEFPTRVGFLLALAAGVEVLHAQRRSTVGERRRATTGAIVSMAIALFLINAPYVAAEALRFAVAAWFGVDAVRYAIGIVRRTDTSPRSSAVLTALGNAAVVLLLVFARGWVLTWVVAISGALRIFGIGWNIMAARVYTTADADETVVRQLGLSDRPEVAALAAEVEASEHTRAPIDAGWTLAFIATLFAIHIGRMDADRTILGLLSPAVAVLGDMLIAVLITLLVINPLHLLWRGPTRWDRTTHVALASRGCAIAERRPARTPGGRVATPEAEVRDSDASGPLLHTRGAQSGASERAPVRGHPRGDRSGLGHELVLRHRELGGRDVELLGGIADRHVARRDGARGAGRGRRARHLHELCHRA